MSQSNQTSQQRVDAAYLRAGELRKKGLSADEIEQELRSQGWTQSAAEQIATDVINALPPPRGQGRTRRSKTGPIVETMAYAFVLLGALILGMEYALGEGYPWSAVEFWFTRGIAAGAVTVLAILLMHAIRLGRREGNRQGFSVRCARLSRYPLGIALIAAVAAGAMWLEPGLRPPLVRRWLLPAPARTPTEALVKFQEAVQRRDYYTAAAYCEEDYAKQVMAAASGAQTLGLALDRLSRSLNDGVDKWGRIRSRLRWLEPLPRDLEILEVEEDGRKAKARLEAKLRPKGNFNTIEGSHELPEKKALPFIRSHNVMIEALAPDTPRLVMLAFSYAGADDSFFASELVSPAKASYDLIDVGSPGEGPNWKIKIPVTDRLRGSALALATRGAAYARAIDGVRDQIRIGGPSENYEDALERALYDLLP
jgi:hypothetical protein